MAPVRPLKGIFGSVERRCSDWPPYEVAHGSVRKTMIRCCLKQSQAVIHRNYCLEFDPATSGADEEQTPDR